MGVALAQYRDEAKYDSLVSKCLAISRYKSFARKFRGAIKSGLHGKRRIFRCGDHFGFSVDRPGRRECDALHTIGTHGLEHIVSCDSILFEIAARVLCPEADVGVSGKMKDKVAALHRRGQSG